MDDKEKKYLDDTREYWAGFPESPVSDTFKWQDARGYEHMLTLRAWSPHNLFSQIEKVISGLADIGGKPITNQPKTAPVAQVQERDDHGLPMIDTEGKPVMMNLPKGTNVYTVKALFRDKTKAGKAVMKVVTNEPPYNTKYGVTCFGGGPDGWNTWTEGVENKFAPPKGYTKVVIRDPEGDSKYPDVIEFRE